MKSLIPEKGEFFCSCNEPGPQFFNLDGSGTEVVSDETGAIVAIPHFPGRT
jgi:hypothetical protein